MAEIPPKITAGIAEGGGRHYRGRGLGALQAWKCVACGIENVGDFNKGCQKCGAGAPGVQTRKPGDPLAPRPMPQPPAARPVRAAASRGGNMIAEQLRGRAGSIDYDEIERRMARALEDRLGGGYTTPERRVLYEALESFLILIDNGELELPAGYMSIEQMRILAQKVAPDEGLEMVEERDAASTTTAPETDTEAGDEAEHNPNTYGYEHGDPLNDDRGAPDDDGEFPRLGRAAPIDPAPEFVDPDPGPDQGGKDNADRDR